MIPQGSQFPNVFDTDQDLFLVHDSLRLQLAADYLPGNTSITVMPVSEIMNRFPPTGLITLTEQCSDIDYRAISFYYNSHSDTTFDGLELLEGFVDVVKPKVITNVTQNVMAAHHNSLKDSLVAIENFVGVKGTIDVKPFGPTIEGRINYLQKLFYTPRAWFTGNPVIGLSPLTVEFTNQSFRLGSNPTFVWNFGDETSTTTSDYSPIQKTYTNPGRYDVSLEVYNEFGEDVVTFSKFVSVMFQAPDEAYMEFIGDPTQIVTIGNQTPTFNRLATEPGGPFAIPPTIRSGINNLIDIQIPLGNLSSTRSYAGEVLNGSGHPIDPIINFTWSLDDDLSHPSSTQTQASYSIGGIYDLKLRCDTEFGSYRITTYANCIDIIERTNLWLFNLNQNSGFNFAIANEYGLISETFKVATRTFAITSDNSFLDYLDGGVQTQAKREFLKNTGFAPVSVTPSGEHGSLLLAWSSGGANNSTLASQTVESLEYDAFGDTYIATGMSITRPWNWIFFPTGNLSYFAFGPDPAATSNLNLSFQAKDSVDMATSFSVTRSFFTDSNYVGGAGELQQNVTTGYTGGEPNNGRFAVYRTAWKGNTGYVLRNGGAGTFFRLNSFYKTQGILSDPLMNFVKLPDMPGPTKVEGELISMTDGIFFFNNSGNIAAYNDTTGTWQVGGPASTSTFRSVQDTSNPLFDDQSNTLLATSDGDRAAYLSFDYSTNAFIKFNAADLTFTNLGGRPSGNQWVMGCY